MPELPEVEVTRRSFVHAIENARIVALRLGKPLRWSLGCEPEALVNRIVRTVGRRGKYLLIELNQGWLIVHLGMSGSLRFATDLPPTGAHDHFELVTSRGTLRVNDPRRFGAVIYVSSLQATTAVKLFGKLGVEPLSDAFDPVQFHEGLKKRSSPIKQVLLAGEMVVGVGNIYASEALFMAGIRPSCRASRLSQARANRLHAAIRDVLAQAIQQGGSTLRDFSSADGKAGYFQLDAKVYGRAGLPCRQCGAAIKMVRLGQRSTFYCPVCQRS